MQRETQRVPVWPRVSALSRGGVFGLRRYVPYSEAMSGSVTGEIARGQGDCFVFLVQKTPDRPLTLWKSCGLNEVWCVTHSAPPRARSRAVKTPQVVHLKSFAFTGRAATFARLAAQAAPTRCFVLPRLLDSRCCLCCGLALRRTRLLLGRDKLQRRLRVLDVHEPGRRDLRSSPR